MENLNMFGATTDVPLAELSFDAYQLRAVNWYMQEHGLKLQLSRYPTVYFLEGEKEVKEEITSIWDEYQAHKRAEQRERARARRLLKKAEA